MNRTARFMSCDDFRDRVPRLAAVHDREDRVSALEQLGDRQPGLIASCAENQPPLTTQMIAAPLAFALGVKTSIVSAMPCFRP